MRSFYLVFFFSFLFISPVSGDEIHCAVKAGDISTVKSLVKKDPSLINAPDKESMTPLHIAVAENQIKIISLLLDSGADVNCKNNRQDTPLHLAARHGNYEATQLLLLHHADHKARNMRGRIPLTLAAAWGGNLEYCETAY